MNHVPPSFITKLFNLYTQERDSELLYSKRARVVRAMMRAMLEEEEKIQKEREV